ncbi:MAG: WbqC family protein, partial [Bacteroidaceae bacterium]|nr:WbqC family protein [Bacteroidaceae bacterium]
MGEPILLEQYEHFHKQTIRNRCTIDSPNGPLQLTVPIDKSNFSAGDKCLMREVRISYRTDWQHQHWNAIQSSYFNSPFFEYLQDDFRPLFQRRWTYLMDMNEAFIDLCCQLIDLHPQIQRTTDFIGTSPIQ